MKRTLVAVLSVVGLGFAALPVSPVWADTAPTDQATLAPAGSAGQGGPGPGGGGGGGGGGTFPAPPYVAISCAGPNNDQTVYPGQQDSCTVSAATGDTFHSGNRVIVTPSGESVAGCFGVQGLTSATEIFERNSGGTGGPEPGSYCIYTVLSGATVTGDHQLGTERIVISPMASVGSAITFAVNACSDGPGSPCGGPTQVAAGGPGGVVSSDPAITVSTGAILATEGQSFSGTVATLSDADPTGSSPEYAVDIVWGDGTDTVGTIDGWSVTGTHTYLEEGSYALTVTVLDRDIDHSIRGDGSATVADGALSALGPTTINTINPFSGTIATFTDADPSGTAADYAATVQWGDGTTSVATVSQGVVGFDVVGSHAYSNLGPYMVTVHVCDAGGACSDTSSSVLVFAYTSGGTFVVGDGSAALGSAVTFWGAQWASANTVSGGATPADFKGFASNPNGAPRCGGNWSTTPGNSSHPPDGVPAYTAVIVTSSITQDAARTLGDSPEVVIVKTDPGYAPDPGHGGTGTIVAVLCP